MGEVADLKDKFPEEENRVLSAAFLENLLTGAIKGVEVHRHGVRIKNAVLAQSVDLVSAEILHETWLINCRFQGDVDLSRSLFRKSLFLNGSSFKSANFNKMKVVGTASFNKAVFAGPVNFQKIRCQILISD